MSERPFFDWDWVSEHLGLIAELVGDHVLLTALAVGIGFAIAFPLAVYAYRHRWAYAPLTWFTGILYTIPSLALFAFLVPFTGLSKLTAEIGLVSYTLLIIVRNTVTGLDGVPHDAREAARGMGYSRRQLLWRVELPLALPAIVAGLRIATVTTIGLVTVTSIITEGGLGALILTGFRRNFHSTMISTGTGLSVLFALAADALLLGAQRVLMPWTRGIGARLAV